MTTKKLLAISGKRFAGKDTFAAHLVRAASARGTELATYAFAAESKRLFAARAHLDLPRLLSDRDYKEAHRPALTEFTVAALAADPQVFVRAVSDRIAIDPRPALITDLRLQLEIEFLRPRFALTIVRLVRSDAARAQSGWRFEAARDEHHTETELDDPALWNVVVDNNGPEIGLAARASAILDTFL